MAREFEFDTDTFPHREYPTGWFQIAWSEELTPGTIKSVHYFGRELIAYRGADGKAVVMSAHCPHMGAHIGHGGWVEGCDVVCPFHGWRWAPSGENLEVPSQPQLKSGRRIRVWECAETNGVVWLWHSAQRQPPSCEPPTERRHEQDFLPVYPHCTHTWPRVHARPQYVTENVADLDHLRFVHKNTGKLDVIELNDLGDRMEVRHRAVYGREQTIEHQSYTQLFGVGTVMVDFDEAVGNAVLLQTQTPVDPEHSDLFITVLTVQDPEESGAEPAGRAAKRVREQIKQADRDMPIWNNMVYVEKAAYTKPEGLHVKSIRDWCRRFYPDKQEEGVT